MTTPVAGIPVARRLLDVSSTVVQGLVIGAALLSAAHAVFYTVYDAEGFRALIVTDAVAAVAFVGVLLLVRAGRAHAAALGVLALALVQIVVATAHMGWPSGVHLYLLAGGPLGLLLFSDRQRALRWASIVVAASVFLLCQVTMPLSRALVALPEPMITFLFTVNAGLTAVVISVIAVATHLRAAHSSQAAADATARAEYLAATDPLTGLPNRRPVTETLEALASVGSGSYCLAIADLDHFKRLNDAYGHSCGDRVLATIGRRLREQLRLTDTVGRWGGEEFVFVLPGATLEEATAMLERVRAIVADHAVPCAGHSHEVTVSIGVTDGLDDERAHRVIKRADDALYAAKSGGRNSVVARGIADVAPGSDAERVLRARLEAGASSSEAGRGKAEQ